MDFPGAIVIIMLQVNFAIASPIYVNRFPSGSFGTKTGDVSCISTRTGETGICMFAAACQRSNGTHLTTCIDRFYFGSCCKLHNRTIVTDNIESNDIPEFNSGPKPIFPPTTTINVPTEASGSSPEPQMALITTTTSTNSKSPGKPETTTKNPTTVEIIEWPIVQNPIITSRPSLPTVDNRIPTSTRFPPRNATRTTTLASSSSTTAKMEQSTTLKPTTLNNEVSTSTMTSLVFSGTVLTNEISVPVKYTSTTTRTTTYDDAQGHDELLHLPGIVTWSSYVNEAVTKTTLTTPSSIDHDAEPTKNGTTTKINWPLETTVPTISTTNNVDDNPPRISIPTENFTMLDYKQVCGTRLFPESRIVGGRSSTFGKWPWQISLRAWNMSSASYEHSCGAVLLTNKWAITVAHCVENISWKHLSVRIGDWDLKSNVEPYEAEDRRVQFVFRHPQFDRSTYEYDMALLRFDKPLTEFRPNILPICLPEDDDYHVGHTAFVTGWGRLHHDGRLPSILHEVVVPVISNAACEAMYKKAGYRERIPNIFICAGRRKGGIDSCEGDSGGPMVIQRPRDKRWTLVGVITWGIGCGVANQPGVYTRISEFRKWIVESIQLVDDAYVEAEAGV